MNETEYLALRGILEAGREAFKKYDATGVVDVGTVSLLEELRANEAVGSVIAAKLLETTENFCDNDIECDDSPHAKAVIASIVFGNYSELRTALDTAAGPTFEALVKKAPEIKGWSNLETLVVLTASASAALFAAGSVPWQGAPVARLLAILLAWVTVALGVVPATPSGKSVVAKWTDTVLEAGADIMKKAKEAAKAVFWWPIVGAGLGVIGALVMMVRSSNRATRGRIALNRGDS